MNPKPLERKIEATRQDIARLEAELLEKKAFVQGLLEALKLFPKNAGVDTKGETVLRHGSDMAKARDFLQSLGRPAHITDILKGIGKENTKTTRLSISSSLAGYARKNEIFAKTAPNTFTLIGLAGANDSATNPEPPTGFGEEASNDLDTDDIPFLTKIN